MSFPLLRWLLLLACWAAAAPALALLAALLVADNLQVARHFEWPHATIGMLAFVLAAVAAMSRRLARALTAEELRGLEQRHRANLLVRATKAGILDRDVAAGAVSHSERYKQCWATPRMPTPAAGRASSSRCIRGPRDRAHRLHGPAARPQRARRLPRTTAGFLSPDARGWRRAPGAGRSPRGMDGGDVCRRLVEDPQARHIPVPYLTSMVSNDEVAALDGEVGGRPGISKGAAVQDIA